MIGLTDFKCTQTPCTKLERGDRRGDRWLPLRHHRSCEYSLLYPNGVGDAASGEPILARNPALKHHCLNDDRRWLCVMMKKRLHEIVRGQGVPPEGMVRELDSWRTSESA